jgi:hypothetical protein
MVAAMSESTSAAVYTVRPMNAADDRESLLRIWARNMSDERIAAVVTERFRWLYEQNPAGPARTWLIISPKGEIVGCGSVIPREMRISGTAVKGGVLADFAVEREHRSVGPAIQLQRAILESVRDGDLDFIYGWPNDKSRGVIKRAGYAIAGESALWTKLLRSREQLEKRMGKLTARIPGAAVLLGFSAGLADLALLSMDGVRLLPGMLKWRAEVLTRADSRFDSLAAQTAGNSIEGKRNSAHLNWRYAGFTTAQYRFLLLTERGSVRRPVGYAVYTLHGTHAVLADFFCEDMDEQMTPLLLRAALCARREGATQMSLNFVGAEEFSRRLGTLQFFRRDGGRAFITTVRESAPETLRRAVQDAGRWFLFDGELDI